MFVNRFIGTLTVTTTADHSGPESNSNEGVLRTIKISRTVTSPPDTV